MTEFRVAIYARFSSDRQSERSIEDQVALCRSYCEREGMSVVAVYDDRAISGASTVNRAGLRSMMRDATTRSFNVVVAEALDRISRDQGDLAAIFKRLRFKGIAIRTTQDGLVGEMHVGIKGLLGELYLKDLAEKTRRGQAGVNRDGRHNGGRSYGYRAVAGQAGQLEIQNNEAEIVRRIFNDYIAGYSPRDIAAALNRESVPGPRGGPWNASTIAGSRKRQNGILHNALYIGRIVWNRQSFVKDPETGRRISRPNPESERMIAEDPELRIVDQGTRDAVQRRRVQRSGAERHYTTRPRRLLSGLLKCDSCGSGYVVSGADKRGPFLRCSRMVETGMCDNKRAVPVEAVESTVLAAIESHLGDPEFVSEYIREFHGALAELRNGSGHRRAKLSSQLADIEVGIKKVVALLEEGPSRALRERLTELEGQREAAEAALSETTPPAMPLPEDAAEVYQKKIKDLKSALAAAEQDDRNDAYRAIRDLVDRIVVKTTGPYPYHPGDTWEHGRAIRIRSRAGRCSNIYGGIGCGGRI